MTGRIGENGRDKEYGYQAARYAGLNIISTLKAQLGDLDRVEQVVKVGHNAKGTGLRGLYLFYFRVVSLRKSPACRKGENLCSPLIVRQISFLLSCHC